MSSSFGQRTGRQNSISTGSSSSSLHQSSSNSSVNNLEVDEKHFLNEIVKHFNKSIVRTSFEYSSSSPGKGETFASTKQSPWRDNSLTPAESNTVSTINSNPPLLQVRTPSGGTSSSGSSRNAVPKTHYHKSDSAMLNYLFDSHVKLRHSDLRWVHDGKLTGNSSSHPLSVSLSTPFGLPSGSGRISWGLMASSCSTQAPLWEEWVSWAAR